MSDKKLCPMNFSILAHRMLPDLECVGEGCMWWCEEAQEYRQDIQVGGRTITIPAECAIARIARGR